MLIRITDRPETSIRNKNIAQNIQEQSKNIFRIKAQKIEHWAWSKFYWLSQKSCIRLEIHILERFDF